MKPNRYITERAQKAAQLDPEDPVDLGPYQHYMQKEIFEQPRAIGDMLANTIVVDLTDPEQI